MQYILVNKKPVKCEDIRVWWENIKDDKNRIVKQETVCGHYVSTVFLGFDHWFLSNKKMLFETMIFSDNEEINKYKERYETWDEAEAGHKRAVELARKTK